MGVFERWKEVRWGLPRLRVFAGSVHGVGRVVWRGFEDGNPGAARW